MSRELLDRMVHAARSKDRGQLDAARAALDLGGQDSFQLLVTAIDCKEAGFADVAEQLLEALTHHDPGYALAHYELGVIYRYSARHQKAAASMHRAYALVPRDFRLASQFAHMLYAIGARPEAERVVRSLEPASLDEEEQLRVLVAFGEYLVENNRGRAKYLVEEVRRSYDWVNTDRVAAEINSAIDQKRPFSLVRLGDGEGAFARIDPVDEQRYASLYRHIRDDWARALFGSEFDPVGTGYFELVSRLMDTSLEADVVGVPYPNWIEHEYSIASLRGIPCVLNVHRSLLARPPAKKPLVCDQIIHIDLFSRGFLEPIVRKTKQLSVISCLSALPEMMKQRFDLEEVELYKIPGEKYSGHLRSQDQMSGVHYPDVYDDITRRLSRPHDGRVFLIAAGTLAKYYAATIKRHGGIALDLGSLVDRWAKISSRPGYDDALAI